MKRLTRAVVGLWVLAALGALLLFFVGGFVFPLIAQARELRAKNRALPDTSFSMLAKLTAVTIILNLLSFSALVSAGLATVVLMFRSRRATLRQINANLLQISEQLKQFQPPRRGGGGPSAGPAR